MLGKITNYHLTKYGFEMRSLFYGFTAIANLNSTDRWASIAQAQVFNLIRLPNNYPIPRGLSMSLPYTKDDLLLSRPLAKQVNRASSRMHRLLLARAALPLQQHHQGHPGVHSLHAVTSVPRSKVRRTLVLNYPSTLLPSRLVLAYINP